MKSRTAETLISVTLIGFGCLSGIVWGYSDALSGAAYNVLKDKMHEAQIIGHVGLLALCGLAVMVYCFRLGRKL